MAGAALKTKPAAVQGLSQAQLVRKRFFGHTGALVALVTLALLVLISYTSIGFLGMPGWWDKTHSGNYPMFNGGRPTLGLTGLGPHPFGQDNIGRDAFAMTMRGAQQTFQVMIIVGMVSCAIGVVVGAMSGYFRGWVDTVLMRLTEVVIIVPLIILAAVLGRLASANQVPIIGTKVITLSILLGFLMWPGLSRLLRAEFLSLREREFVDAARIAGASDNRIMFKHILPNGVSVIIVETTLLMSAAIITESALSYLGLGVQAPDVSLGKLISDNKEGINTRPWLFWWPGLFIVLSCLCINFIGDGLRDAFDPRQKKFAGHKATPIDHPELDEMDSLPPVLRDRPATTIAGTSANGPQPGQVP